MRSFTENLEPPVSIGAARTEILSEPAPWTARFNAEGAIVCRDIFDPALLVRLLGAARTTRFRQDRVPGVGTRQVEEPQRVGGSINLLLQRANLLAWLQEVTGRAKIAGAEGRVHQSLVGGGHALDWHDDLIDPRRQLGITIDLTEAAYTGGSFELRSLRDPAVTRTFRHDRVGTALIFDIRRDLEHRLLPVLSGGPRRVFAGWFTRHRLLPAPLG